MQPDSQRGARIASRLGERGRVLRGILIASVLLSGGCGRPDASRSEHSAPDQTHAHLRLISERASLVPGGTITLGVDLRIDPEWHLYWNGQNETGYPIRVRPALPPGYTAGDLQWPAPVRHVSPGGILDHVYRDRVTLLFEVHVPPDASSGQHVRLGVHVTWMACRSECIPEEGRAEITLPIAGREEAPSPPTTEIAAIFAAARASLPRPREEGLGRPEAAWAQGSLHLKATGASWLAFYPDTASVAIVDLLATGEASGDSLVLTPRGGDSKRNVSGVLAVTEASPPDTVYFSIREPLPEDPRKETDR